MPEPKRRKKSKPSGRDVQAMRRGLIAQGYAPGDVNREVSPSRTFEEIAAAVEALLRAAPRGS